MTEGENERRNDEIEEERRVHGENSGKEQTSEKERNNEETKRRESEKEGGMKETFVSGPSE